MATMQIFDDVRKALDADRITWAEAGMVTVLRRKAARLNKKIEAAMKKVEPLRAEMDEVADDLTPLEWKVNPQATEPETDEGGDR